MGQCSHCGASLVAEGAAEGVCPTCLIQVGLEGPSGTDDDTAEGPTRTLGEHDTGSAQRIGPYRILEPLGHGGMGEVFLAEQTEPVRRKVALKLIKRGMDTKRVVARFESERQALAMMDHPNIAKVYDAGATPEGRPYFAMEYVRGVPITEFCDRNRLRTGERLLLFMEACEGVQHAHQKGIIHRDLKPSNVLVAVHGDRAVPKIIDFGVAKATESRLTEKTVYTELGQLIGTPEYMSPEQAELTSLDIDTRTDVYSLGVLLYQLLTGALPFSSRDLREAGFDEIRRKIREDDPPRPSTRISTFGGERSAEAAKARRTDPSGLRRRVRGDLDWIAMKALEKDRRRRYGSPSDLAADINRHLEHQPVIAGPPGAGYRAKKFIRRNKTWVGFVTAAALALLAFSATVFLQAGRIANERDRANAEADAANRVSSFMAQLFEISDPGEGRGQEITVRELLDRGTEQIKRGLQEDPLIRARLLMSMSQAYRGLAMRAQALELAEETLRIREEHLPENHRDIGASAFLMAWILSDMRDIPRTMEYAEKTLAIWETALEPDDPDLSLSYHGMAYVLALRGELDEAERYLALAAPAWEGREVPADYRAAMYFRTAAMVERLRGNFDEALVQARIFHEVFDRIESRGRYWPPNVDSPYFSLSVIHEESGNLDEALRFYRLHFDWEQERYGGTRSSHGGLAELLEAGGHHAQAIQHAEKALAQSRANREQLASVTRGSAMLATLARSHLALGEVDAARPYYREVIELWESNLNSFGDISPYSIDATTRLATLLHDAGEHESAERVYRIAIERSNTLGGPAHERARTSYEGFRRTTGR